MKLKYLKPLLAILSATAWGGWLGLESAHAQTGSAGVGELILGAPGVGLTYRTVNQVPFSESSNIGRYFRFTFTGIEAQADADGVPGTYSYDSYMWNKAKKSNNGHGNNCDGVDSSNPGKSKEGLDSDPTIDDECKKNGGGTSGGTTTTGGASQVPGTWTMWAIVNGIRLGNLSYSSAQLNKLSSILRLYLSTPITFREQTINLTWAGDGTSKDPDGHFYILGSAIKEPPVPIGEIKFTQTMYAEESKPPFTWTVTRE